MATRITNQVTRSETLQVFVDGHPITAWAGETLATVLMAEDVSCFYLTGSHRPRAPYCNMGTCFECLVGLESDAGMRRVRACMTRVAEGMRIRTGTGRPAPAMRGDKGT